MMITSKNTGNLGEQAAEHFLLPKGYRVINRNFRGKSGEIDIIATQRDSLIFIEVKTRKNDTYATGREAVTLSKQKKIKNTAREFIAANRIGFKNVRFDVIECYTDDNSIEHFVDAF